MMRRYAILSSTADLEYAAFLPVTMAFWTAIGYEPACIVVDDERWTSDAHRHVLDGVEKLSGLAAPMILAKPVHGFKPSTVAQVARLAAASFPFRAEDYLLTGDADMLPLSEAWFHQQDPEASFHVLGSDAYGTDATHFPICYLGGTAVKWRGLMDLIPLSVGRSVERLLKDEADSWGLDEALAERKLRHWSQRDRCQLIPRGWTQHGGYACGRLDRGSWHLPSDLSTLIDCHSVRPLSVAWPVVEKLVDYFLPPHLREFVKSYVAKLPT